MARSARRPLQVPVEGYRRCEGGELTWPQSIASTRHTCRGLRPPRDTPRPRTSNTPAGTVAWSPADSHSSDCSTPLATAVADTQAVPGSVPAHTSGHLAHLMVS